MKCKKCSTENPNESKFCSQCGTPLAAEDFDHSSMPYAERRQLSVVFSDIIGSTALSELLDPEELWAIIHDYQAACSKVIGLYEGYLAKYLGDGILAYFGYPDAHEDDARRSIQAGLGIIEAMGAIRERFLRETGVQIDVRVGIHTGLVVVGDMDKKDILESNAIVGNAPNLAARIQSAAEPNSLVISAETYKLTRGYFEVVDLGTHEFKGISQGVQLYRIVHESTARNRLDAAFGNLTPLAGRDEEIQTVIGSWHRAEEGSGQLVLLGGEAGVGKSRIVLSLKERASNEPDSWLTELRCSPYHQNSSFYPVIDFLERVALRFEREDSPVEKLLKIEGFVLQYGLRSEEAVPLLATLLSVPLNDQYRPLAFTPQRLKQKTIETLIAILTERATRQPVLFIVEDIHWIDPSTLELLDQLILEVGKKKILIFLTYRPQFIPHWQPQENITKIDLSTLSKKNAAEIIRRVAGDKDLPQEVIEHIITKTSGIPLFLEELTKMMLESQMLVEKNGKYELSAPLETLGIPTTLQDSLTARLDRMKGAKVVAQLGAAIGREFSYEMLDAIPGPHHIQLRPQLDRLVQAGILFQKGTEPKESYTFKHALIQDSAYSSLLKSSRRNYHQQIAETLETKFTEISETRPELLAHHYTEAQQIQKAVQYWLTAGVRSLQQSANMEAISHLRRGLALIEQLPDPLLKAPFELQLHSALGPALLATQGFAGGEVALTYERASELSTQLGDGPHLFLPLSGQWIYNEVAGKLKRSYNLANKMKNLATTLNDSSMLVEAYRSLGTSQLWRGECHESLENLTKAINLYNPAEHYMNAYLYGQDTRVAAYCSSAFTHWLLGFPEKAVNAYETAIDLAETLRHPFSVGWGYGHRHTITMHNGNYEDTVKNTNLTIKFCTEQAYPYWIFSALIQQGWALTFLGKKEGIPLIEQGLGGWDMVGAVLHKADMQLYYAEALHFTGQFQRALELVESAMEIAVSINQGVGVSEYHRLKGNCLGALKRYDEAEVSLKYAIHYAHSLDIRSLELKAAASLYELLRDVSKEEEGREILQSSLSFFTEGENMDYIKRARKLLRTSAIN